MKKDSSKYRSGQVVAEYVLILTFVVMALAATKIKIKPFGGVDYNGSDPDSKTVLDTMSHSITVWMQDILIIVALPS